MGILNWLWVLVVLTTVYSSHAQVGLRTAPLTAPRIRHRNENNNQNNRTGMEVFSKWPSLEMGHRRGGSRKIESELAAIFRGVAYGVSTLPPTTVIPTTTTSTTTAKPVVNKTKNIQKLPTQRDKNHKTHNDNQSEQRHTPLNPTNFPDWRELEFPQAEIHQVSSSMPDDKYPYVESPEVDNKFTPILKSEPKSGVSDVQVVRADGTDKEWIRTLGVSWFIHIYTAAGLYSILAFMSIMWIIRVKVHIYLLSTGYYIIIQVLMFVAAFLRSVHLFHDPYGAENKMSQPLSQMVEDTAWPCLTAAVAVVVIAIVRSWQCPRLVPQHNYVPLGLALITTVHLLITLTSLLTAYLVPDQARALNAASRTVTLLWGSTVGICGLFATWKVGRVSQKLSGQFPLRHEINHLQTNTPCHNSRVVLVHGTNLVLVICLTQISLAGLHLYALVGPHYILDIPPMYPWFWMVFQSTARILEIISWVLLCATSALKLGTSTNKRSDSSGETKLLTVLGCQCCGTSTSIATHNIEDDDIYPDMYQTHRSMRNFTHLNYGKGEFQETLSHPLMGHEKPVIRIEQNLSINRSLAYQDNSPEEHMYWNSSINLPNTNLSHSPMMTNESGFVRFKMNAEQSQAVDEVLQKSLQNLDLVSQIHDLKVQNTQLSQKILNTSEYSDDPPPYEKTAASPLLSRKPSIGSPQPQPGGNLMELLHNQHNMNVNFQKPTPQSTSNIEVSQYYQNPSSASYHTYASLHRPSSQVHPSQQNIPYSLPNNGAYDYYEQNKSQSRALSSPNKSPINKLSPTYLPSTENVQDINMSLGNSKNIPQFKKSASLSPSPKRSPHPNLRHGTPDSGLAMDYYGYANNTSGDDIHIDSNNARISSRLCSPNQEMQQCQYIPQNYRGGVKSIELVRSNGNRPQHSQYAETVANHQQSPVMMHININSGQQQSPLLSPSRPPQHPGSPILQEKHRLQLHHQLQERIQLEQLRQQSQQREKELLNQRQSEQNKLLRIPIVSPTVVSSEKYLDRSETDRHQELKSQASPLLIRSDLTNGSNSNLHFECLDSEDEIKCNQNASVESDYENGFEPDITEAWPLPSRLKKQAAV